MERLAGLEPACITLEERCLNPLGHRRAFTSERWYRGRGSNSTAPLCRRGALDQKATPAFLAVGAGFEPAHKLVNSQLPCHLATPQKLVGDLGFEPRFSCSISTSPRPSGLIRFPSPRKFKI